jgi:hypothetical protein
MLQDAINHSVFLCEQNHGAKAHDHFARASCARDRGAQRRRSFPLLRRAPRAPVGSGKPWRPTSAAPRSRLRRPTTKS